MEFDVFCFEIARKVVNNDRIWRSKFWESVDDKHEDLSGARGCYIFATKRKENFTPWYVGKTEKQTFKKRVLSHQRVLDKLEKNRVIYLFLLRASASSKKKSRSISYLESILIGMALGQNRQLCNVSVARMLKKMTVPGVINSGPGPRSEAVKKLTNTLGL